jgi:hypothetical protein
MNFIDEALLEARAGNGGAGSQVSEERNLFLVVVLMVETEVRVEILFLEWIKILTP